MSSYRKVVSATPSTDGKKADCPTAPTKKRKLVEIDLEADTQPISPPAFDLDAEDETVAVARNGFELSLAPVPEGNYSALSLPFMSKIPEDLPKIVSMGTWRDHNLTEWVVLVTDLVKSNGVDPESVVLYKVYDKTRADKARDEWLAKNNSKATWTTTKRK